MEKQVKIINNKKVFLLGQNNTIMKVWLMLEPYEKDSYGMLFTSTNKDSPLFSYCTFDTLFFKDHSYGLYGVRAFNKFFTDTTLTNYEAERLCTLMEMLSKLVSSISIFKNETNIKYTDSYKLIKDNDLADKIENTMIPALISDIERLLMPKEIETRDKIQKIARKIYKALDQDKEVKFIVDSVLCVAKKNETIPNSVLQDISKIIINGKEQRI